FIYIGSNEVGGPSGSVAVRNLNEKRETVIQADIINDVRKFFPELLCKKDHPVLLIGNSFFQSFLQLVSFMNDHALHSSQTHAGVSINIDTDQKHFHRKSSFLNCQPNLPRIIKEMIRP